MLEQFMKDNASELEAIRNNVLTELQPVNDNSIVFTPMYVDARIYEIAKRYTNMGMPSRNKLAAIRRSLKKTLPQDAAYLKTKNRLPIRLVDSSTVDIAMPLRTRDEARQLYADNKAMIDCSVEQSIVQYYEHEQYEYICEIAKTCVIETLMYHADAPVDAISTYFKPELMLEFEYLRSQNGEKVIAL